MSDPRRASSWLAALSATVALGACAQAGVPAPALEQRLLVKLVRPSEDPSAIADAASRAAGLPVRYAASVSPAWHALIVRCADAASCAAAVQAMRQATSVFEHVDPDSTARAASP